ncbi:MAG: DUF2892 domain-containing protein [Lentisphaerae bacterium]|nr:DUF2892 domain-containing protein [Lentisphaerota bacterium]
MYMERCLRGIAGTVILVSLLLAVWLSKWWLLLTAFVGLNLFQSAFSNWCPMMTVLKLCGVKSAEEELKCRAQGTSCEK